MSEGFGVVVGAGTHRSPAAGVVVFPHRWTAEGVTVEADFTGAHLLHLAAAGCVLNDVYREAEAMGLIVAGVRVTAQGAFASDTWASTGVTYEVSIDAAASPGEIEALLTRVDAVAEIPRAIRQGAPVTRTS